MRLLYLSAALALLLLFFIRGTPVSLAESPTPTLQTKNIRSPRSGPPYVSFLPLIFASPLLKKGVALTYYQGYCQDVALMNASWEYAWVNGPPNCPGVENVPMIWDEVYVNWPLGGNSDWIMGFNEPDQPLQADLTGQQAAELWYQIEQMYPTRKLLSPATLAVTTTWIVSFRDAYISTYGTPPRLDGLALHCFAWTSSECVNRTQEYINLANSWGIPEIWVTEFSFATNSPSSPSGSLQEMQTFINWMVSQPKITRYAWYGSRIQGNEWWALPNFHTPLIDWNTGQPTAYGNIYIPYQ